MVLVYHSTSSIYLTMLAPHGEVCPMRHVADTKHIRLVEAVELDYTPSLGTLNMETSLAPNVASFSRMSIAINLPYMYVWPSQLQLWRLVAVPPSISLSKITTIGARQSIEVTSSAKRRRSGFPALPSSGDWAHNTLDRLPHPLLPLQCWWGLFLSFKSSNTYVHNQ